MNFEGKDKVWQVGKQTSSGRPWSEENSHVGEAALTQGTAKFSPGEDLGVFFPGLGRSQISPLLDLHCEGQGLG